MVLIKLYGSHDTNGNFKEGKETAGPCENTTPSIKLSLIKIQNLFFPKKLLFNKSGKKKVSRGNRKTLNLG